MSWATRSDQAPSKSEGTGRTVSPAPPGRGRAGAVLAIAVLAPALVGVSRREASTPGKTTSLTEASGQTRPRSTFSFRPWISGDGRFVAFDSDAHDLGPGDTSRVRNIFIYDRDHRTVVLVSEGPGGRPADGDSQRTTVSHDGRYVATGRRPTIWSTVTPAR